MKTERDQTTQKEETRATTGSRMVGVGCETATDYNLKFSFRKKELTCRGCISNNHLGLFVCRVALTLVEAVDNRTSVP